jgi:polyhydroxyalkanoate synthesis repressor PhaR
VKRTTTPRRAPAAPSRERLIKRYGNRKLYDPAARKYVTLDGLATMIGRGDEVKVVDQATGHDLTSVVLAQVILEGQKQRTASIPQQVLARLIRLGRGPAAAWADWLAPHDAAARARQEAERIVSGLVSRGRLTLDEALTLRQEIVGSVQRLVTEAQSSLEKHLRGLLDRSAGELGVSPALQALKDRLLSFGSLLPKGQAAAVTPKRARRSTSAARARRRKS